MSESLNLNFNTVKDSLIKTSHIITNEQFQNLKKVFFIIIIIIIIILLLFYFSYN